MENNGINLKMSIDYSIKGLLVFWRENMDFVNYMLRGGIVPVIETLIYWMLFKGTFEKKRNGWSSYLILSIYTLSILAISYLGTFGLPSSIKLVVLIVVGCIIAKLLFHASWKILSYMKESMHYRLRLVIV